MNPLHILIKHFWLFIIIIIFIKGFIFYTRANKKIKSNPELKDGYKVLVKGYLLYLSIPWVIMGIGIELGGVPNLFYFFRPQDGNLFVLSWYGSIILYMVFVTYWIFLKNGAEMLSKHPGLLNFRIAWKRYEITNTNFIKFIWVFLMVSGIAFITIILRTDFQIPNYLH